MMTGPTVCASGTASGRDRLAAAPMERPLRSTTARAVARLRSSPAWNSVRFTM